MTLVSFTTHHSPSSSSLSSHSRSDERLSKRIALSCFKFLSRETKKAHKTERKEQAKRNNIFSLDAELKSSNICSMSRMKRVSCQYIIAGYNFTAIMISVFIFHFSAKTNNFKVYLSNFLTHSFGLFLCLRKLNYGEK
jgi:hypothetical protein